MLPIHAVVLHSTLRHGEEKLSRPSWAAVGVPETRGPRIGPTADLHRRRLATGKRPPNRTRTDGSRSTLAHGPHHLRVMRPSPDGYRRASSARRSEPHFRSEHQRVHRALVESARRMRDGLAAIAPASWAQAQRTAHAATLEALARAGLIGMRCSPDLEPFPSTNCPIPNVVRSRRPSGQSIPRQR